jgi:hypothetical protein
MLILSTLNLLICCVLYFLAIRELVKHIKVTTEALRFLGPWLEEDVARKSGRTQW